MLRIHTKNIFNRFMMDDVCVYVQNTTNPIQNILFRNIYIITCIHNESYSALPIHKKKQ